MSHAGTDLDFVLLYLHSTAPSVAELPSMKLQIYETPVDRKSPRHSLDHPGEAFSVRFASREKAQHINILSRGFYRNGSAVQRFLSPKLLWCKFLEHRSRVLCP